MDSPPPAQPSKAGSEPVGYDLVEEPPAPAPVAAAQTCMGCGALMRPGATLCARCGLDSRAGVRPIHASDGTRRVKKCSQCGYELTGLKRPICPECGASFSPRDYRRLDREHSESVRRSEWIKPAVMLGVGWSIMLAHALATGGPGAAGIYLVHYAEALPVGIFAFVICCICGLGFDAPWALMAWRLAGAFALIDAAVLAGSILPNAWVYLAWSLPGLVSVAVFEHIFDLDWPEAAAAGLFTYAARMVTVLAVTGQLAAFL